MSAELNAKKINAIQKVVTLVMQGSLEGPVALGRIKLITEITEGDLSAEGTIQKTLVESPVFPSHALGRCTGGLMPLFEYHQTVNMRHNGVCC